MFIGDLAERLSWASSCRAFAIMICERRVAAHVNWNVDRCLHAGAGIVGSRIRYAAGDVDAHIRKEFPCSVLIKTHPSSCLSTSDGAHVATTLAILGVNMFVVMLLRWRWKLRSPSSCMHDEIAVSCWSLPIHHFNTAVAYLPRYAIHEGDTAGHKTHCKPYGNFLLVAQRVMRQGLISRDRAKSCQHNIL